MKKKKRNFNDKGALDKCKLVNAVIQLKYVRVSSFTVKLVIYFEIIFGQPLNYIFRI